jgi:putative oxidoreductase
MSTSIQNSSHPALSGADGLATSMSDIVLLIGRIFIGWIFVRSGYGKLFDIPAYAATFPARGLPTFLAYCCAVRIFGGLALMFGLATGTPRWNDLSAGGYVELHRYRDFTDAAARRAQDSNFYKNMAILGGIFFLFGRPPISLDARLRERR